MAQICTTIRILYLIVVLFTNYDLSFLFHVFSITVTSFVENAVIFDDDTSDWKAELIEWSMSSEIWVVVAYELIN